MRKKIIFEVIRVVIDVPKRQQDIEEWSDKWAGNLGKYIGQVHIIYQSSAEIMSVQEGKWGVGATI